MPTINDKSVHHLFFFNTDEIPSDMVTSTARKGRDWYDKVRVGDAVTMCAVEERRPLGCCTIVHKELVSYLDVLADPTHNTVGHGKTLGKARAALRETLERAYGANEPNDEFTILHFVPMNNAAAIADEVIDISCDMMGVTNLWELSSRNLENFERALDIATAWKEKAENTEMAASIKWRAICTSLGDKWEAAYEALRKEKDAAIEELLAEVDESDTGTEALTASLEAVQKINAEWCNEYAKLRDENAVTIRDLRAEVDNVTGAKDAAACYIIDQGMTATAAHIAAAKHGAHLQAVEMVDVVSDVERVMRFEFGATPMAGVSADVVSGVSADDPSIRIMHDYADDVRAGKA